MTGTWILGAAFFALVAILVTAGWARNEAKIKEEETQLGKRSDEPLDELLEPIPHNEVCGAVLGASAPCQQPPGHYGDHDYCLRDEED